MVEIRTWPEDAFLLIDPFIGDAVVVCHSTVRGHAKLFQNVRGVLEWEVSTSSQTMRDVDDDVGIASCLTGRIDTFLPMDHAPLGAAAEAVFFLMQAAGKHHISVVCCFGHEEVNHAEEFQLRQSLSREVGIGERNQRIEAHRQQTFDFSAVNRIHDFLCAVSRLRKFLRPNAPYSRHVLTGGWIRKRTLTGKLIALLSVLSSALTITLAGNHRWSGPLTPDIASSKCDVYHCRAVLNAL